MKHELVRFCKENKFIVIAFVLSTAWFMIQHASGISWDFSVYVLNGRYLFWHGMYFDWGTPPIVPVMLGLLQPLGALSEYTFILIVSLVWLAACLKLADTFSLNRVALYALALNPAVLCYGLRNGTELLAAAFLMIFFVEWLGKKKIGGAGMLAAATLVRYPSMIFAPLLLTKDVKRLVLGIVLMACMAVPWIAFNWIVSGSPFTSVGNSLLLNALQAEYVRPVLNLPILSVFVNFVLPLAVVGIVLRFKSPKKVDWAMLAAIGLVLVSFATIAVKDVRYMFAITVPAIYFGEIVLRRTKPYWPWLLLALSILIAISASVTIAEMKPMSSDVYMAAATDTDGCALSSNAWVFMNYVGVPTEQTIRMEQVGQKLAEGYRILLFSGPEPDWQHNQSFVSSLPKLVEREDYVIYGYKDKCAVQPIVNSTYAQRLNEWLVATGRPKMDVCQRLFPKALCELLPIKIE